MQEITLQPDTVVHQLGKKGTLNTVTAERLKYGNTFKLTPDGETYRVDLRKLHGRALSAGMRYRDKVGTDYLWFIVLDHNGALLAHKVGGDGPFSFGHATDGSAIPDRELEVISVRLKSASQPVQRKEEAA